MMTHITLMRTKTIVMTQMMVINVTTIGSNDHDHHCDEDEISKQSVAVAVCLVQELVISQWQPTCIS